MLFSKNGSIPKPEADGTEGWVEVPDPPIPPEGMETVWWCPPGWVVRPPMPVKEGYFYKWSQSQELWMEFPDEDVIPPVEVTEPVDPPPVDPGVSATLDSGSVSTNSPTL